MADPTNPPDEAAIEAGRKLFTQACNFVAGAATQDRLPPAGLTEIAFAGRSNVGKSSLINALVGQNSLARTSRTPGRTQQINFFDLGGRLMVVDLPGYGYARASKSDIAAWTGLVNSYLKGRVTLRRVMLLIDARHGLKPPDRDVMSMLDDAAVVYQIILTKADKTKPAALEATVAALAAELLRHPAAHPEVATTSALGGLGIAETRASIAELAESL
ncbi:MAG: ribosome biogenesis GTP-binding protein YihA/YsxC [Alphaproteobacteria bacterium]|jgi:GTP-binding protein